MPRKTKEINAEENIEKSLISNSKTKVAKKKSASTKVAKLTDKVKVSKTATKAKATKDKETEPVAKVKKAKATKSDTTKKAKKSTTKAEKSTSKRTTKTKSTSKTSTKSTQVSAPENVEYYDLPYKYNQTVVKVLYQNPTTLFVYWEISDNDIENYKKTYGDNFFETTRPVLLVHNDTMNYHFEVDINDFANSWYFNINDSKCEYRVELIRKPITYNDKINSDYIYISSSNAIEAPNDRILFSTDEPYIVYFRNTKNNHQRKVDLRSLLEALNLTNKKFGFPLVRNVYDLYKIIYKVDDIKEFSTDLNNPSSGNPSSGTFVSRFH